jgi:hypothetical protein
LRKRQRDEALQAQVELLAAASLGHRNEQPADVEPLSSQQEGEDVEMEVDETEAYTRAMSPPLFEPGRLSYEDRQLTIVKPIDDLRALVRSLHFFV